MILRRLSNAFRKQDWFTVFVETLIVVFGVFIGLQVNNWNNENTLRSAERQLLSQLQNDVQAAVKLKTEWLTETRVHRTSLIEAINVIQNIPDQETTSSEECRAMWSSHLLFYPVTPLGSLHEVLLKGTSYTARGKALRPSLLNYRDQHTVIDQLNITLSGLANLGDTYSDAFPRHLTELSTLENPVNEPTNAKAARITDETFTTACLLTNIRANNNIQNKLLSNLARTDGVLQRVKLELATLEKIHSQLVEFTP